MGIIVGVILILLIVVSVVIGNITNRAEQTILKGTPLSTASINRKTEDIFAKKSREKFMADYGDMYTKEDISNYFSNVVKHLLAKDPMTEFSNKVIEKMNTDKKIDKLQAAQAQITSANIISYAKNNNTLAVNVITNNGRDEYVFAIFAEVIPGEGIKAITRYTIDKGAAIGF